MIGNESGRTHRRVVTVFLFTVLFFIGNLVSISAQRPAPPEHSIRIHDGGFVRTFDIALDEIYVEEMTEPVPARPSAKAIQEYAIAVAAARDKPTALVLYEQDRPRTPPHRRILSDEILVKLEPDTDASAIAKAVGAVAFRVPDFAPGYVIIVADDALGSGFALADKLLEHPGVQSAEPILKRLRFRRSIPNDPLFSSQWHLRNTGQGGGTEGLDIRVTNVWAQGYSGAGVIIGIVDDGLQFTHPDISPNYVADYSRNWNGAPGGLFDPSPITSGSAPDDHGTPCAGLVAARGNNNEGVSGVAPQAGLSGLRLISSAVGDSQEAEAMAYSNEHLYVKSNSWGPFDAVDNLEAPGPLTQLAFSNSVVHGRHGRGTIHVWAGGNGLTANDNANYDGYANSIYTISVSAIKNTGEQTWYSEPGACHVITAPGGESDIVTTDLMGMGDFPGAEDYTDSFQGTSAATPIVAGTIALMLEANPMLGWRDVQEILIATARQNDPGDSDWSTNGAGFTFNHKYGAGLIDADAAVTAAIGWSNLGPHHHYSASQTGLNVPIPDNDPSGITQSFPISADLRVEHVTVTVDIEHTYRGDLQISLISPSGTTSVLAETRNDSNDDYDHWTFMTVRNWGEEISGTWDLHIADLAPADIGTLYSVRLDFWGASTEPPEPDQPPILQPIGTRSTMVTQPLLFEVTASDVVDNDLITLTASNLPPWATFAPTSAMSTVSQTFSGTPTTTGTWFTTFYAADKDGVDSETVQISAHPFIASNLVVVIDEGFDDGLPHDWSITTNAHPSAYWRFDNPGERNNYVGGSLPFAIVDSDHAGEVDVDTELRTPAMNLISLSHVYLRFRSDFFIWMQSTADVDVSLNGAHGPWSNVWRRTDDAYGTQEWLDLSDIAAGEPNVMIRFRYHNANNEWWWQVDDVEVYGHEVDSDGDGIPDAWELYYFGDLTTADATSDYSGNGFLDLHAFLANTDPTDPNSALRIEGLSETSEGAIQLQWQSAPDRHYRIGRSTNLPHFTAIQSNIPATPPLNTFDDESTSAGGIYFYRIELDN